jgi:hypothetical protein
MADTLLSSAIALAKMIVDQALIDDSRSTGQASE